MTGISEECWAVGWMNGSGWMNGLDHYLWRVAQGGERGYGMQTITERQATLLKLLSEEADGWWVWDDDGPRFISLTAWQAKRASLTSPQKGGGKDASGDGRNSCKGVGDAPRQ